MTSQPRFHIRRQSFAIFKISGFIASIAMAAMLLTFSSGITSAASKSGARIAILGTDDQLYTCAGDCSKTECITCPVKGMRVRDDSGIKPVSLVREVQDEGPMRPERPPMPTTKYGWPTFSPDGSKLAFSWIGQGGGDNSFGISVYDFAKHDTTPIFASRSERIDYVFWTPNGKSVSFLLGEPQGLSLIVAELKEKAPVRMVLTGMPIYYAWNHSADRLVVHTNSGEEVRAEHVALMSITPSSQEVIRTMSKGRLPFKTPCWSPDEKHLAYIANNAAEAYLVVADTDGANPKSMVSLPIGESSFVWAPDSRHLAYSSEVIGADSVLHGIRILDLDTGESQRLTSDDVAAFFYSPDGRNLAYISVPSERPFYVWNLADLKTGKSRKLDNFLATQEESVSYHYFDQLALSHTIWSPDSSSFVYAGVRLLVEPDQVGGPTPEPQLWIEPVDGSAPHSGHTGTLAFSAPAS